MDSSKISSSYSPRTLLPEAPKNRFEPLTFSENFHPRKAGHAIEQRAPSCMKTALKVVLAIPLYLVWGVAKVAQAIGNAGVWTLNKLSSRSVEVVNTPKPDHPPAKEVYGGSILKADKPASPSPLAEEPAKTETTEELAPSPKEVKTSVVEEPSVPVIETPVSTTTTLIEKEPGEDKGGWEWDANNPSQIRVRYPEPVVPSNKGGYLTTALGVIGLTAIALPTLYYGYNYLTLEETPTHAWRLFQVMGENAFGCMKTLCDGTFECVDNCPKDLIPEL